MQVARGLLFEGRTLTLVDAAPSTIRVRATTATDVGHICTGTLLDRWAHAALVSPTRSWWVPGRLALMDADAQVGGDAAFIAGNPRVTADGLVYDAEAVAGAVPAESGACVLYLEWGHAPRVP